MDSDMVELVVWASIAAVMVYLLYTVLGKREGFLDKKKWDRFSRRFEEGEEASWEDEPEPLREQKNDEASKSLDAQNHSIYEKVKQVDPTFSLDEFLQGAKAAFGMIIESFAIGDRESLKHLLSTQLYTEIEEDINQREADGETLEAKVIKIITMEIRKLGLLGSVVWVDVQVESEQFNLLKDKEGKIIEGSENQTETLRDQLTFERNISSNNPNWVVVRMAQ